SNASPASQDAISLTGMETGMQTQESFRHSNDADNGQTVLDARALLDGRRHAFLRLDEQTYRLSLTRQNKLILTK
ncbi:MAG: hemin uptake protein HemP, partial [Pseudomonadota bacterium]